MLLKNVHHQIQPAEATGMTLNPSPLSLSLSFGADNNPSLSTMDTYLRAHFRRSLRVHSLGGDIRADYTEEDFDDAFEKSTGDPSKFMVDEEEPSPLRIAVESWDLHEQLVEARYNEQEDKE